MAALVDVSLILTVWTVVYVPAATENVGVAAGGAGVPVPETAAVPVLLRESVAVRVALLVPTEIGLKVSDVANEAPDEAPNVVPAHAPVVAAENADAEVPVNAKVTVGGVAVQPPSLRNVVTLVAVIGF
jgi:hypothetical protein